MQNLSGSTNEQYHANRTHLSSSMFKLLLKDPAEFDRQWNHGIHPSRKRGPALEEGSFVHTLCLEPDKVMTEYAFFEGLRKAGPDFRSFAEANPGKTILRFDQRDRCYQLFDAFNAKVEAVRLLTGGMPEFSITGTEDGLPVKARADYINHEQGYIVDLKTTMNPTGIQFFSEEIDRWRYDLSAALYLNIAEQVFNKPFDFYFIVLSKDDILCDIYRLSVKTRSRGQGYLTHATKRYKQCMATGIWTADRPNRVTAEEYTVEEV